VKGILGPGFKVQGKAHSDIIHYAKGICYPFTPLEFRVKGLGAKVQGLGFGVQGLGFRV